MTKRSLRNSDKSSDICRRSFIFSSVLGIGGTLITAGVAGMPNEGLKLPPNMMDVFNKAGVPEAAQEIGLNFGSVFAPLAQEKNHPYRRYRWSVSYSVTGGPLIQALPPEEEIGWIPWEEWFALNGQPVRRAMVLFPVKEMIRNVPLWWTLDQSQTDLLPRCAIASKTLRELFRQNRVYEAAIAVGFDAQEVIIEQLSPNAKEIYLQMRWSVAPHRLAADLPVIQCLPPPERLSEWPWETWYTDGKTPLIHHVHYSRPMPRTGPKSWREQNGAPQRPSRLFGHDWYWYNDESLIPALAKAI